MLDTHVLDAVVDHIAADGVVQIGCDSAIQGQSDIDGNATHAGWQQDANVLLIRRKDFTSQDTSQGEDANQHGSSTCFLTEGVDCLHCHAPFAPHANHAFCQDWKFTTIENGRFGAKRKNF